MNKIILFLSSLLLSITVQAKQDVRIISLGSSITELVYALDAEQQLVGIDITSRYFDNTGQIPQVGYHRQLSAEGLLSLNPTHVLGSSEMGPDSTLVLLRSAGIKVITVTSGDSEQDLATRIDTIANLTDKTTQAEQLKQQLHQDIQQLQQYPLAQKPKALFAMLSAGRPATIAGSDTTINKIIQLSGANNPAQASFNAYKPMSFEAIVAIQPDYLLVSQRAWDALGGQQGILKEFPLLAATPAAQQQRIIPISSSAIIGGFGIESIQLSRQLQKKFSEKP